MTSDRFTILNGTNACHPMRSRTNFRLRLMPLPPIDRLIPLSAVRIHRKGYTMKDDWNQPDHTGPFGVPLAPPNELVHVGDDEQEPSNESATTEPADEPETSAEHFHTPDGI